MPKIKHF